MDLGGIGRCLVGQAVGHSNNVVVIDQDETRCSDIPGHHDVLAITGNATDKSVLEEAGIDRADAFVATTGDDAVNLMACWLEKEVPRAHDRRDRQPAGPFGIFQGSGCPDQREPG